MGEPVVFDKDEALKRVDGDRELFAELLTIFFEEYPGFVAGIREARSKGDGRRVQEVAHSMKSAVGNLGAMKAFTLAQTMENNGKQGRLDAIDINLRALEDEISRFREAVAEFNSVSPP